MTALAAADLAEELERKLVGEDLVIGEAAARGAVEMVGMRLAERIAPGGPALAREERRLDPFGQLWRAFEREAYPALVGGLLPEWRIGSSR